ncbi:MAG: hypothetical protein O8C61_00605 [Candidatus Methanoperedens sp.]|nr:hypothetical protein [Candidatus Methanoperedens sp.]
MASSKGKSKSTGKVDQAETDRLKKFDEQLRSRKAPIPKAK